MDEIPEEQARDGVYQHHLSFLEKQRQDGSTALLSMTSSMYVQLFLKCL